MRLDLYGSVSTDSTTQLEQLNKTATDKAAKQKNQLVHQKSSTNEDTFSSSSSTASASTTASVGSLTSAALQASPSRAARVLALKQSVSNAQYDLDSAKIAEALSSAEV